jgi:hypothetical protein
MSLQQTRKPASKLKMVLMWFIFLGFTTALITFLLWTHPDRSAPSEESSSDIVHIIVTLVFGGFFLIASLAAYFILIATNCLTFNFQRPVWMDVKVKLYFANIAVLTALGLGIGLPLGALAKPFLTRLRLSGELAFLVPVMAMLVILQILQVFVLKWAPLERRLIAKRLQAQGVTPAQLETAMLVGLSNPLQSSFKKFSSVEEDIGALWIGPDQLVYWGDREQFGISRQQLTQLERRADAGGTTMLAGLTHLILHCQLPDGSERQIRLHTEGHWTMGGKRRAMDELEDRIAQWHGSGVPSVS